MRLIFLTTHLGSGFSHVCEALNRHQNVRAEQTNKVYLHPTDIDCINNDRWRGRTYIDTVLFNHHLANPAFLTTCEFVYLVEHPKYALNEIVKQGYSPNGALDYYHFRLRRMYEMAYKTPGSAFFTTDDLETESGQEVLKKFLGLNNRPRISFSRGEPGAWTDAGYKKYLSKFGRLDLQMLR